MKQRTNLRSFLFAASSTLLAISSAHAVPYNWTGATNGFWNTGSNWSGSSVPLIGDDLTILGPGNVAGALTINFDANNPANSLNFTNTAATFVSNTTSGANRTLTLGSGGITTGAGAVTLGSATANQAVNITLNAAQTWNVGAGGLEVFNVIGGAGIGLTKSGTGTLTLRGTNTYSGGLTIKAGSVTSNNGGTGGNFLGSGTVTIGDIANTGAAANLNFLGSNFTSTNAISVVGNGASSISVNGWSQTLNGGVTLNNNLSVITNNPFGSSLTFGGGVTGTGNLVIQSNAANNVNTSSNILFQTGALNMVGSITNSGTGSSSGSGNINTTISAVIGTNVTGVTQNSTNSQLTLQNTGSTYTGNVAVSLGTLNVSGVQGVNNPTSGALGNPSVARQATIASGATLNFNTADVLGQGGTSNTLLTLIANGGTIRNNGTFLNSLGPVQLNGGTLNSFGAGAGFKLTGTVTVGGSAVSTISATGNIGSSGVITYDVADAVAGSGSDLNVTAVVADIFGPGGINKTGVGTMTLSATNTFTGQLTVGRGTLAIATINNISANGTLGNSALPVNLGTTGGITGTLQYTGSTASSTKPFTLASGGTGAFQVDTSGQTLTLSGLVNGGGNLTKTGAGTLSLTGATNSYSGGTTLNQGTLTVGTGALGATTGTLSVNNTNTGAGTNVILSLSTGADTTVGSLSGTIATPGSGTNTATINTGGVGRNFTVNQTSAGSYAGVIAGAGSFTLGSLSTNTLTLSGANTYTGTTNINAGTLLVNGSTAAGSAVTVGALGTLGGSGTIGGATSILGTHSPGTSPGIQTFGSTLTYSGGTSVVNWELIGNTVTNAANPNAVFDTILVGSNLDFAAATALNLSFIAAGSGVLWSDGFWATSHTGASGWLLYDVTGSTSNLGNLNLVSTNWLDSGSFSFNTARPGSSFSVVPVGNDIYLNYNFVPVPEPSSLAMLAFGMIALWLFRNQR